MRTARVLIGGVLLAVMLGACAPAPLPSTPSPSDVTGATSSRTPTATPADPDPTASPPVGSGERVVVLDPGHNGGNAANPRAINQQVPDGRGGMKACNTTGTATDAGYAEHEFTFDVAGRVAAILQDAGIRVVLTRPDNDGIGPCVDERGRAGEEADADAVVSIHADGSAPGNSGFHVALSDPPLNDVQRVESVQLATDLRDAMRAGDFPDSDYIGRDGLSPRRDLAGLNHATRPTVLVECANMRNPDEAELVSSADGRARYAAAIAAGIVAFLDRLPPPS